MSNDPFENVIAAMLDDKLINPAFKRGLESARHTYREVRPIGMQTFIRIVREFRFLDLDAMQAAGFFAGAKYASSEPVEAHAWREWTKFRHDPIDWFLRRDDETQRKLWTMVERRINLTMTVSEEHRTDERAAP